MTDLARVLLSFHCSEQSSIDLALEYWAIDSEGRWTMTVQEIADRIGEKNTELLNWFDKMLQRTT